MGGAIQTPWHMKNSMKNGAAPRSKSNLTTARMRRAEHAATGSETRKTGITDSKVNVLTLSS